MAPAQQASAEQGTGVPMPKGLSEFAARVLDQLSLSSWFPAALLAAGITVLLQFRDLGSADLIAAVGSVTSDPLQFLVLVVPTLVVATVVTQAFSFESIRTLEGYWPTWGPFRLPSVLMTRLQLWRKARLLKAKARAQARAFQDARPRLLKDHVPVAVVNALEADALECSEDEAELSDEDRELLDRMTWTSRCEPWRVAHAQALAAKIGDYPVDSRVMPTRLGNVLRSTEDKLAHGGELQSFVLRNRASAPARVMDQHDEFRVRLDMYCTLVFVSLALALVAVAVLIRVIPAWQVAAISALFVVFAAVNYAAALSSARGYCSALREIDRVARAKGAKQEVSTTP